MRLRFLFILLILAFAGQVFSQKALVVKNSEQGLYLEHNVAAKENFYSIGRLYNVAPKELAAYNKLDMSKGLNLGQTLKIPLNAMNFSQASNSTGTPVFYIVGEKEGLFRVSSNNNKVLMADLRKWNKLSNDNISTGSKLIVGFLKSAEAEPNITDNTVKNDNETNNPDKTNTEIKSNQEKTQVVEVKNVQSSNAGINGESGYFKLHFEQQAKKAPVTKDQTVTAGIFKTASGWQDKKYYMLIDKVEPGTIVKLINPSNNKAIYAKVLGEMSGIRQNAGLDIRISNAAATALEINDPDKFIVKVNY